MEAESWERRVQDRTLDCTCERKRNSRRMQIVCSAESKSWQFRTKV